MDVRFASRSWESDGFPKAFISICNLRNKELIYLRQWSLLWFKEILQWTHQSSRWSKAMRMIRHEEIYFSYESRYVWEKEHRYIVEDTAMNMGKDNSPTYSCHLLFLRKIGKVHWDYVISIRILYDRKTYPGNIGRISTFLFSCLFAKYPARLKRVPFLCNSPTPLTLS